MGVSGAGLGRPGRSRPARPVDCTRGGSPFRAGQFPAAPCGSRFCYVCSMAARRAGPACCPLEALMRLRFPTAPRLGDLAPSIAILMAVAGLTLAAGQNDDAPSEIDLFMERVLERAGGERGRAAPVRPGRGHPVPRHGARRRAAVGLAPGVHLVRARRGSSSAARSGPTACP